MKALQLVLTVALFSSAAVANACGSQHSGNAHVASPNAQKRTVAFLTGTPGPQVKSTTTPAARK